MQDEDLKESHVTGGGQVAKQDEDLKESDVTELPSNSQTNGIESVPSRAGPQANGTEAVPSPGVQAQGSK